jgi:hypothetical protein
MSYHDRVIEKTMEYLKDRSEFLREKYDATGGEETRFRMDELERLVAILRGVR